MGSLFKQPKSEYEMAGQWPGITGYQQQLVSGLGPIMGDVLGGFNVPLDLWGRTAAGEFLDVTKDPLLLSAIKSAQDPAMQWFEQQRQGEAAPYIRAGLAYSSPRGEAMTRLAGEQSQNLANLRYGYLWPALQQRRGEMYAAAGMYPYLLQMLTGVGAAGGGTPMQTTFGPSIFQQLFQAYMASQGIPTGGGGGSSSPYWTDAEQAAWQTGTTGPWGSY